MGKPNGQAALFAIRLRKEMDARNLSVRGLGKLVDSADPERGRRRVQRHLSGKYLPSKASRVSYAEALGLPRESFLEDGESDEEEDLSSPLTRAVVRRVLREELARFVAERVA